MDIVIFLGKQNLSLRGHRERPLFLRAAAIDEEVSNQGNFLELVEVLAKYDLVLREHITRDEFKKKNSISYLSPEIQNEFIEVLGGEVKRKILQKVKEAKYYSIILDSTPDADHKAQTSQILRYVSIDGDDVKIEESFVL